jgi:REP element-mobilizing transposase RayT
MDPIYTRENCRLAYKLNWSLSVFWHDPAPPEGWLAGLQQVTERDGIRLLRYRLKEPHTGQFLLSTKPGVCPVDMVRCVKGRLQYLVRSTQPKAFRRNYSFRSIGSARREVIEEYVATQHAHHPMADPQTQKLLERFSIARPEVDLSKPRTSGHSSFWYDLHVVLVNDGRFRETDVEMLERMRQMIARVADQREHLLSRAAILADHIHLALGCKPAEAPYDVALCYMNNLAFACGMRAVFRFSAYVGTFGEYDVWVPDLRKP